jgi:hypothetical protein
MVLCFLDGYQREFVPAMLQLGESEKFPAYPYVSSLRVSFHSMSFHRTQYFEFRGCIHSVSLSFRNAGVYLTTSNAFFFEIPCIISHPYYPMPI